MDRFLQLFGDSPRDYVVNSALMAFIAYWVWRLLLRTALYYHQEICGCSVLKGYRVLEITPPKQSTDTQPLNTQSLFAVLQMNILKAKVQFHLRSSGIKRTAYRYRVIADKDDLPSIQKHLRHLICPNSNLNISIPHHR
jgi:hypothetical protein